MGSAFDMVSIVLTILPFAAVGLSLAVLIDWLRQRRAVRRAGVSEQSPGCTKCLYLVRGWNSSICPECGTDVSKHGVVIGTRVNLALKIITAFVLTLAIALPLSFIAARTLFTRQWSIQMWQTTSINGPAFEFHLRTTRESGVLLTSPRYITQLVIAPPGSFLGLTVAGPPGHWLRQPLDTGADPARMRRVEVQYGDPLPTLIDINRMIGEVVGTGSWGSSFHATALSQLLADSRSESSPGSGVSTRPNWAPNPALFNPASSGAGSGTAIWPPAMYAMWIIPLIAALLAALMVYRRHRPGWRPARIGEWSGLSQPHLAG